MKQLDVTDFGKLPGIRLRAGETFRFRCHPGIGCFNRCCRNLNLFLYPYDVIRLRTRLGLTSDKFLDRHVDVVLRPGSHFPDVLLRMAENEEKTLPVSNSRGLPRLPRPARHLPHLSPGAGAAA